MRLASGIGIEGRVDAYLEDPATGKVLKHLGQKNLVTTTGFQNLFVRALNPGLGNEDHLRRFPSQIVLGSSATAAAESQTDLQGTKLGYGVSNPDSDQGGQYENGDYQRHGFAYGVDKWENPSPAVLKMTKLFPAGAAGDSINSTPIREYGLFGPLGFHTGKTVAQGLSVGGNSQNSAIHRHVPQLLNVQKYMTPLPGFGDEDARHDPFYTVTQAWLTQRAAVINTDFPGGWPALSEEEDIILIRQIPHRIIRCSVSIPPFTTLFASGFGEPTPQLGNTGDIDRENQGVKAFWDCMSLEPDHRHPTDVTLGFVGDPWGDTGGDPAGDVDRAIGNLRQDPVGDERGYQLVRLASGVGVWRPVNSLVTEILDERDYAADLAGSTLSVNAWKHSNVPVFRCDYICQARLSDFVEDATLAKPELFSRTVLPDIGKTELNQLRVVWTWTLRNVTA